MKNTFSKVLFCGIVASSVILVNCQKSPNRGVKSTQGGGAPDSKLLGTASADGSDSKLVAKTKCEPGFISKRNDLMTFVNLMNEKKAQVLKPKTAVSDADKKQFTDINEELGLKCAAAVSELNKTSEKACIDDVVKTKDQKSPSYSVNSINATCDMINASYKEVSGVASSREKQNSKTDSQALDGKKYIISTEELVNFLTQASAESKNMIMDGDIVSEKSAEAMKSEKLSACAVTKSVGSFEKDAEITVVNTANLKTDTVIKRSELDIYLTSGSAMATIKCSFEGLDYVSSFNKAFANQLVKKTEAKAEPAVEAKTDATSETKTQSQTDTKVEVTPAVDAKTPATPVATTSDKAVIPAATTPAAKTDAATQALANTKLPIDPKIADKALDMKVVVSGPKAETKTDGTKVVTAKAEDKEDDEKADAKVEQKAEVKEEKKADAKAETAPAKAVETKAVAAAKPEAKAEQKAAAPVAGATDFSLTPEEFAKSAADTVKDLTTYAQLQQALFKQASAEYKELAQISKWTSPLKYMAADAKYSASNLKLKQANAVVKALNEEYAAKKLRAAAKSEGEADIATDAIISAHKKVLEAKAVKEKADKAEAALANVGDMTSQD